jgi:uncharacterized protein (TIGR02145 family)
MAWETISNILSIEFMPIFSPKLTKEIIHRFMKKQLRLLCLVLIPMHLFSQAPQKMSYQAVIRNASNTLVINQSIGMRISILQGSVSGTPVYVENHSASTNVNGLVSIEIGGGNVVTGSFAAINWANGPYFIKTETDPSGGVNYTIIGTSQLLSVPYALHANSAANGLQNGNTAGQMMYWNGTAWITINPGSQAQTLTICNGIPTWTTGGACPPAINALNCAGATNNGTLTQGIAAAGINSLVTYTGGNGGVYSAQSINSTGVTGLTATRTAGTLAIGSGTITYTITGTPSASGTASFALNIGGQSCNLERTVRPQGTVSALSCSDAINNGVLRAGSLASGVNSIISYTGGDGGAYNQQSYSSTGVSGLTATLSAGVLANGNGTLTLNITGTPATSGTANFVLNIGGQICTLSRVVNLPFGLISTLNCNNAIDNGVIINGTPANGVSSIISYTGGNGGTYATQSFTSTGVTGLTATIDAGTLLSGNGNLTFTITGTPSASGLASFALNIGGKTCTLNRTVYPAGGMLGITTHTCGATNVHNAALPYGTMTDQEGNEYKTIQIGNQVWMAENLRVTKYNNGVSLTNVTANSQWETFSSGAYASYENKTTNDCPYGKLYNWFAVFNTQNICPTGWHVPTDIEWNGMMAFLDQSFIPTNNVIQSLIAGGKMKSTGIQYWQTSNTAATNNSGFSGLPGGERTDDGEFISINTRGYWWAKLSNIDNLWNLTLFNNNGNVNRESVQQEVGASVRCVKD